MASSCHHSKISTTFVLQKRVAPKMMTCKDGYGILNEIKQLALDNMEQDYMHIKGHKRGQGTSRNLRVVVESQMVLFGIFEILKGNFMSLRLFYFHIHSLSLIHGQRNRTEPYSYCIL